MRPRQFASAALHLVVHPFNLPGALLGVVVGELGNVALYALEMNPAVPSARSMTLKWSIRIVASVLVTLWSCGLLLAVFLWLLGKTCWIACKQKMEAEAAKAAKAETVRISAANCLALRCPLAAAACAC